MGRLQFDGQLTMFDITIPFDANESDFPTYREVAFGCQELAKKWVFQKESGDDDGYIHWQIRLSLHKKTCCSTVLKHYIKHLPGHWSVTSNEVHDSGNQFNYVMKLPSRLEGPWTDKDNIRPAPIMTTQLQTFLTHTLYEWQIKAKVLAESYDERFFHYIFDPHYNSGKSVFAEWLEYQGLAEEIPPFTLMEDIMQFVMCQPVSKCYLFDMPAAMKKINMHQMYAGLEMLKNGFLYDKRYKGKKRRISRPALILYANSLPQSGLIAPDRMQVWYLTPDKDLVRYDHMAHPFDLFKGTIS